MTKKGIFKSEEEFCEVRVSCELELDAEEVRTDTSVCAQLQAACL